jgi:hypothetical protein
MQASPITAIACTTCCYTRSGTSTCLSCTLAIYPLCIHTLSQCLSTYCTLVQACVCKKHEAAQPIVHSPMSVGTALLPWLAAGRLCLRPGSLAAAWHTHRQQQQGTNTAVPFSSCIVDTISEYACYWT